MARCQPVSTNQRLPFPSIISRKVSYLRVQMFIHGHKNLKADFPATPDLNTPCDDLSRIPVDSYIIVVF